MALKARLAPSRSPVSWAACADSSSVSGGSARSCSALRAWRLRLGAVAGGDRGQALGQLAIAAPAPAVAPAFEQRARRADDPAIEQPQRRSPSRISDDDGDQQHADAGVEAPAAQFGGDGARPLGQPHRAQHRDGGDDEPDQRAQDGHRISAPRPAGRRRAPRAGRPRAWRRDAPRRAPASRRWPRWSAAAATSRARPPWRGRRPASAASARASLASAESPCTSAPTRRSETRPLSLPSSRCQKESSARSSARAALATAGNAAARRGARGDARLRRRAAARRSSSPSLASPWASGVSRARSVAKGRPAVERRAEAGGDADHRRAARRRERLLLAAGAGAERAASGLVDRGLAGRRPPGRATAGPSRRATISESACDLLVGVDVVGAAAGAARLRRCSPAPRPCGAARRSPDRGAGRPVGLRRRRAARARACRDRRAGR